MTKYSKNWTGREGMGKHTRAPWKFDDTPGCRSIKGAKSGTHKQAKTEDEQREHSLDMFGTGVICGFALGVIFMKLIGG